MCTWHIKHIDTAKIQRQENKLKGQERHRLKILRRHTCPVVLAVSVQWLARAQTLISECTLVLAARLFAPMLPKKLWKNACAVGRQTVFVLARRCLRL